MDWLIAAGLGMTAGLHTSTWGMFKDSPHEGFTWPKYFRSALIGLGLGPVAYALSGLDVRSAGGAVVLWGLVYVLERAVVEYWKTFLRVEDQSKYFIPMQFSVRGKVVQNHRARVLAAIGYAFGVLALVGLVAGADLRGLSWPWLAQVLVFGSIGGWISAFGGAWKDAPLEGFETLKFFRSPSFTAGYALLLSQFTDSLLLITFPALGYTIATIETYKTFFFPSKPRGKFAGKPVLYPDMLKRRKPFAVLYAAIWAFVASLIVAAILAR